MLCIFTTAVAVLDDLFINVHSEQGFLPHMLQ